MGQEHPQLTTRDRTPQAPAAYPEMVKQAWALLGSWQGWIWETEANGATVGSLVFDLVMVGLELAKKTE